MNDALSLDQFLRLIPKAELHCHLFGTVREPTLRDLARRAGAPYSNDEIASWYVRGEKPRGVLHVLRALDDRLITRAEDLARLTREYLEDAAAHGVRYSEVFWNPTGTARLSHIPFTTAQDAILGAMRETEQDRDIVARLVPSIDREASPDEAVTMVEWMIANRRDETIGLGIDYRETDRPPELFAEAYRMARAAGFKLTAHAGEFGCPAAHIRTAIELLRVDRIDHGYTIIDDPILLNDCVESQILFTVVPTNSYYLRTLPSAEWAARHPIRFMGRAGLRMHPNTDDPTLHGVTPTRCWRMMTEDFGYDLDELRGFMLNGIDGAWIDDSTRRSWHRSWAAEFDALRCRLPLEPGSGPSP
jgi:adenosine deaminase